MLPRIEHIVFIAGGVLVQRLEDLVLEILDPGQSLPHQKRLQSSELERRVANGDISSENYCRQMTALVGVDEGGIEPCAVIAERVTFLPGVVTVLTELAEGIALSLVSDYARQWIFPFFNRSGLDTFFNGSNTFFLDEHKAPAAYPALFSYLVKDDVLRPGYSLWVDYNSSRTSAAIRHGIDAALFIDAKRFYRDLGLWSLVPMVAL
jgi:FMN phosphatase YigB (HAD superfamily)